MHRSRDAPHKRKMTGQVRIYILYYGKNDLKKSELRAVYRNLISCEEDKIITIVL